VKVKALVERALPEDAVDQLVAKVLDDVGKALRKGMAKAVAPRMLVKDFVIPANLRPRRLREAERRQRAGQSPLEIGQALDALVHSVLEKLSARAMKRLDAFAG
jgi:hypothetical protein